MSLTAIIFVMLGLAAIGFFTGRARATAFFPAGKITARQAASVHSRPGQHGWFVALWALVPALVLIAVWSQVSGAVFDAQALESVPVTERATTQVDTDAFLNEVRGLATGEIDAGFDPNSEKAAAAWRASASSAA